MSRLLRALEDEGLIQTLRYAEDARRRTVNLTAAGQREFEAYEKLSDSRATRVLSSHRDPESLLAAIDLIASALTLDQIDIRPVDPREEVARYCLERYYDELQRVFEGGFNVEKSRDPRPEKMMHPQGAFLVAVQDSLPIGCVALIGDGREIAEIKRLWVSPCARGLGCGRLLMEAAENEARALGIRVLRLDTNRALTEATDLYRRTGWGEIDRFNEDPYAHLFFEKALPVDARERRAG
jgi:ribosomal protein S18 acetylase RimI-like enzyme